MPRARVAAERGHLARTLRTWDINAAESDAIVAALLTAKDVLRDTPEQFNMEIATCSGEHPPITGNTLDYIIRALTQEEYPYMNYDIGLTVYDETGKEYGEFDAVDVYVGLTDAEQKALKDHSLHCKESANLLMLLEIQDEDARTAANSIRATGKEPYASVFINPLFDPRQYQAEQQKKAKRNRV